MGKKIILFFACMLMTASMAFAQIQTVTGTVIDSDTGEPLVGAAVKVEGTTVGVLTDVDGKFTLNNLPKNAKMVEVSFMGMNTVKAYIKPHMAITLTSNAQDMNEVMVVAYGTATRSSFTGSAAVVGADVIDKKVATNVTAALAGTAAGVQFMSSNGDPASNGPTIRIRGIGSIEASNSPLYVVDGVPYDGAINAINPADVESMTVLKDAASTALYGARASNGVVIITTKKGRGQKTDISFDAKWGSNSRLIPQYDVIDNPGQYYEMIFKRLYNSEVAAGKTSAAAYAAANNRLYDADNGGLGYQIYTLPAGENLIGTNFKLNPNAKLGYSDGEYYYTPDNWYDAAFHNSFRQEYNVNLSGSTERLSYYAGGSFLDDGGIVENSGLKRYTGRMSVDYQVRDWLKLTTSMNYAHTDAQQPSYTTSSWASSGNLFYIANNIAPIYPLYVRDAAGNIMTDGGRRIYDANQTNFTRPGFTGNAVRDNMYNKDKTARDVFDGRWGLTLTPVKGLALSANLAVYNSNSHNNYLSSAYGSSSAIDGAVEVSSSRGMSVTQQYMADYKTDFGGSKHSLDVLIGYEQRNLKSQSLAASNAWLFNPFVAELSNAKGDFQSQNMAMSSNTEGHVLEGVLTRAQYSFNDRFFLDASYRRDASSRFAPGHRWGNFGSVGFAWQMKKENFLKDVNWIDMLKFKASYGKVGNEGLGNYYVYADMYKTLGVYNAETNKMEYSTSITQKGNKELTWEGNHSINVGFDFNLFKNRLNGTVEYFVKKTTDMLFYHDFPLSAGYPSNIQQPMNVGNVINHGIEISLDGVAIRTKDIDLAFNANLTHYKNKILELHPDYKEDGIKYGNSILREGGSIYQTYMYKYAGTDKETGAPMYYKEEADGTITKTYDADAATKFECGTTLPKVFGGFGTSFRYKDFDLSAQFSYQLGGKIYDGTYQSLMCSDNSTAKGMNIHKDLLNAWTPENRGSNVPLWKENMWSGLSQSCCDYFLTSSNYLSINNITLGYSLPKTWMDKMHISGIRVYVSGENLAVFSKRQGLDPRFTTGLGSMTTGSGRNGDYYAAMRSIVGGVSVKF